MARPHPNYGLPQAMRDAARAMFRETPGREVGMRDVARRCGVSPTSGYRHYAGIDDLMAGVAADGFDALAKALTAPGDIAEAYLAFAAAQPDVFHQMFGPLSADRAKHPALDEAVAAFFDAVPLTRAVDSWSPVHGAALLMVAGLLSAEQARRVALKNRGDRQ